MWLEILIPKKQNKNYDISELARMSGLSYGTIDCKPVLRKWRVGYYTIFYDPDFLGNVMQVHQAESHIEECLNFPAGPRDIDSFFHLVRVTCELMGTNEFYMEADTMSIDELEQMKEFFIRLAESDVEQLTEEINNGERDGYVVYGSQFPIALGRKEFREIRGDYDLFTFLIDAKQRAKEIYADPYTLTLFEKDNFVVYDIVESKPMILPKRPDFMCNSRRKPVKDYIADFRFTQVRYSDFIKYLDQSNRFDDEHFIVTVTDKMMEDIGHQCSYDIVSGKTTTRFTWGRPISDGARLHASKILNKNLDTDYLNGFSHLANFLRWSAEHDLINPKLYEEYPELRDKIQNNTCDLREIICSHEAFNGRISVGHFTEEGEGFADSYFRREPNGYSFDVDLNAEEYFGSHYNDSKYKNEAYLFIPYDDNYYQNISKYIDSAWESYKSKHFGK